MDFTLLKIARRAQQGLQVLFSPNLTSPEKSQKATQDRYASQKEIAYYKKIAHCGFEDFEEEVVLSAFKDLPSHPSVLVIGCGTGREAFAFEKLGCQVTGLDLAGEMINFAKSQNSNCHFLKTDVFSIPACHFDLVYVSSAINGHFLGRHERLRFYRRLHNFCHADSLLISIPDIRKLNPRHHQYWASQVLRLRHLADGNWEPGDTARSFLGNHNDDAQMIYYHYYPSHAAFSGEMQNSGFQSWQSQNFIFSPSLTLTPQITHVGKYFPPENHGGMESSLYDISKGLVKNGVKVTCLVNSSRRISKREIVEGIEVIRCGEQTKLSSASLSTSFLKELAAIDADLIHLHAPNPLAALTGITNVVPLIVSYHCDVLSYPLLFKLYQPLLELQLAQAKAIVVSSPQLIENSPILKKFKEKCQVIPFGIDPKELKVHQPIQNSLRELKNIYGKPLLLFVGRLVNYKGIEYLIRAMKDIDALLAIVGEGPEAPTLKKICHDLHLEEKVHFFGAVPRQNLGAYYKESEAFILPSVDAREAFGICLIEAMSFGKPLVTTAINSGVNFVNQNNLTGFSVPPKDSKALAEKINLLLNDNELCVQFGNHAKKRFEELFTLEQMSSAYLELYQRALGYRLFSPL